jgi:BMFP domain-containing protein YqiC
MRVLRDKFEWSGDMLHDARGKLAKLTNRVMPVETVTSKKTRTTTGFSNAPMRRGPISSSARTRTCCG